MIYINWDDKKGILDFYYVLNVKQSWKNPQIDRFFPKISNDYTEICEHEDQVESNTFVCVTFVEMHFQFSVTIYIHTKE